jgi:hypothetical protein
MIDSEDKPPPANGSEALLYDWFKHLTSLSLLTLGGILSISQLVTEGGFKKHTVIGLLIAVGLSGVIGFTGAESIVNARTTGAPLPKSVHLLRKIGSASLGLGVGAFLYIFTKVVYK